MRTKEYCIENILDFNVTTKIMNEDYEPRYAKDCHVEMIGQNENKP